MHCSLPSSSVHGISQAEILGWVAISSSREFLDPGIEPRSSVSSALAGRFFTAEPPGKPSMQICMHACMLSRFSCVQLFVTLCSSPGSSFHGILQARILCPPPQNLPDPGIELASPALTGVFFFFKPPGKAGEYGGRQANQLRCRCFRSQAGCVGHPLMVMAKTLDVSHRARLLSMALNSARVMRGVPRWC